MNIGTRSSTDAVQMTFVPPTSIRCRTFGVWRDIRRYLGVADLVVGSFVYSFVIHKK